MDQPIDLERDLPWPRAVRPEEAARHRVQSVPGEPATQTWPLEMDPNLLLPGFTRAVANGSGTAPMPSAIVADGYGESEAHAGGALSAVAERDTLPPNIVPAGEDERLLIHMLGGFRVTVGSRFVDESAWYLRKARSLLKLLALAPQHRLHREQIMDVLWPELEGEAAANNLHKALHVARRILEPALPRNGNSSYLHLHREFVILALPGASRIDAEAFQALAQTARLRQDPLVYEEALRLYTGDLLPEDRCEDWVVGRREELKALHITLRMELAGLWEERGDVAAAMEALRQVVANDPVHEEAHYRLMRLLVRAGRRHLALRQYQQLRDALRLELDAEPDQRIQAFYAHLLRGDSAPARLDDQLPPATPAMAGPAHRLGAPALVGRELELEAFHERLDTLFGGRGGLVLLRGEVGVGKSRLAAEVRKYAAGLGVTALWSGPHEHEAHLPCRPFCVALEGFARGMARLGVHTPLSDTASRLARQLLADVSLPDPQQPALATTTPDYQQLFPAIADFFRSLAANAPVLVVLDDLHAADEASLRLLHYLAATARDIPLLLVGIFTPELVGPASVLSRLEQRLAQEGLADYLDLPPLSFAASTLLVTALLGGQAEPLVLERVYGLASGNPHYTQEAVRALRGRGQLRETAGQWRLQTDTTILSNSAHLRRRGSP